MDKRIWQTKLHARLHDPAEKALVLLRDPAGHEGGTVRQLHRRLFPHGLDEDIRAAVKRADWWASAADRPQFPRGENDGTYVSWAQVNFAKNPVLIHPLSGEHLNLRAYGGLSDASVEDIKDQSYRHFESLLDAVGTDNEPDLRRVALTLWRFGPEWRADNDRTKLGELWRFLPADTRIPDHSIWDHLDLTAAFAGAFIADSGGDCSLLSMSVGPVQEFIAAARTTSDLWAGSHLLSRLTWEAMRVICDAMGPDAIIFPRLRGIPQVDLWLMREYQLPKILFEDQAWWVERRRSDANPLFSAALPNRFLALVPAGQAQDLARRATAAVRGWVKDQAKEALHRLLKAAKIEEREDIYAHRQIEEQLAGFPEVHWAAVPYSELIELKDGKRQLVGDTGRLARTLAPFFPEGASKPGFLGSAAWRVLDHDVGTLDGSKFYQPNPGVLYPAIYELVDRLLAATKSERPFAALTQEGYRCSLTGENEWLTHAQDHLALPPGRRTDTLWARVAAARPTWARNGEHLGALATLKRLWPTLFVDELKNQLGEQLPRFVVSTHTMALATSLQNLVERQRNESVSLDDSLRAEIESCDRVALPRLLVNGALRDHPDADLIARIPAWLEMQSDLGEDEAHRADGILKNLLGHPPEAYYALLLMDGDRMGQWLSGDPQFAISYLDSFHPEIRDKIKNRFIENPALARYLKSRRAMSPNHHMAISGALNDFSTVIAREIVEDRHLGRVLYAGGDDLMAMLAVSDLLPAMDALRRAYRGQAAGPIPGPGDFSKGYARLRNRVYMTMGKEATASIGAVIAHHQAPLSRVLRALREAEQRAKHEGGRNAFSIRIIKRAGGAVTLTLPWQRAQQPTLVYLRELADALRKDAGASRRAAYNVQGWAPDLPEPSAVGTEDAFRSLVEALLHQQFERQHLEDKGQPIHARRLAQLCPTDSAGAAARFLESFLSVAEFLARECRSPL